MVNAMQNAMTQAVTVGTGSKDAQGRDQCACGRFAYLGSSTLAGVTVWACSLDCGHAQRVAILAARRAK